MRLNDPAWQQESWEDHAPTAEEVWQDWAREQPEGADTSREAFEDFARDLADRQYHGMVDDGAFDDTRERLPEPTAPFDDEPF